MTKKTSSASTSPTSGSSPLLTKDDEVRLAQAIEAGNAARKELEEKGKDAHRRPASASCSGRSAPATRPSATVRASPTSASWSRSPRSTRPRACRCST